MEMYTRSVFQKKTKAGFFQTVLAIACLLFSVGWAYGTSTQTGVVANVAPDWSSSAISTISVDPEQGPRIVQNNLFASPASDISVKAYGAYYYRLGKYQEDSITRVHVDAPNSPIWQYTTNDPGESDSNPYDLVFVSSTKAYLIRYGSKKAWIVNPSATTQGEFKIGELDLSSYAVNTEDVPEMAKGVIAEGKLFIILQRQDDWFCPSNTSYVAVFDVATDTEIDTGKGEGGRKGIPLPARNPLSMQYMAQNNRVYIQCVGSYPGFCDPQYEYTGGIVSIDPQTYATSVVLDDGDAQTHPYGVLFGMLIVSPLKGYIVGYENWGNTTLFPFNPTSGVVGEALKDYKNVNIAGGMDPGTYLDKNDRMWVCNQGNGTVDIVNTADNSLGERLNTNLNPQSVAFCTVGAPLAPTLGYTMTGDYVTFHWNTVSGADGYYLWAFTPQYGGITAAYDWGTNTSGSVRLTDGMSLYIAIIAYNADGFGEASNVVRAAYNALQ